ncbi:MAG: hypothetical protein J7513_17670 [Solirubrobacteraceae bacterium]|nr:hypothetical protein [Solirubrobacteraceae bacterium]
MSRSMSSRRSVALAVGATVLCCPSAVHAASGAVTNTYEQITRATGPAGASKMETATRPDPSWVSDGGVVAAWTESPSPFNFTFGPQSASFRNTFSDKTRNLGAGVGQLLAVSADERTALFRRFVSTDAGQGYVYAVGTIDGGGLKEVPGIQNGSVPPQLSGNGKYVVTSDSLGLRRFDVAAGTWSVIAPIGIIAAYSVSDDGQSIAGLDYDQAAQRLDAVVWKNGVSKLLVQGYDYRGPGTDVMISPDGSTAFTVGSNGARSTLTAHKLSGGAAKTTEIPFDETWAVRPLWISPKGDQIAWALNDQDASLGTLKAAQVWTVGAAWKAFGGAFAKSLKTDNGVFSPPTKVSRNGLYAALAYNDQIALVSLSGKPLAGNVGGRQGLSASSFLDSPGVDYCGQGFSSVFSASYVRPAEWMPAPKQAKITVANGTTVLADATWTNPAPAPNPSGDFDNVFVNFPLNAPHTRNVSIKVLDGNGRTVSEKFSVTLTCAPAAN